MSDKEKNLVNLHREKRPWGDFLQFTEDQQTTVKILDIEPGQAISLQYHKMRDEFWYIIRGSAKVILDEKEKTLESGDTIYIGSGTKHRIINVTKELVAVLEISFGDFEEDDEVILKDKYHRERGI